MSKFLCDSQFAEIQPPTVTEKLLSFFLTLLFALGMLVVAVGTILVFALLGLVMSSIFYEVWRVL